MFSSSPYRFLLKLLLWLTPLSENPLLRICSNGPDLRGKQWTHISQNSNSSNLCPEPLLHNMLPSQVLTPFDSTASVSNHSSSNWNSFLVPLSFSFRSLRSSFTPQAPPTLDQLRRPYGFNFASQDSSTAKGLFLWFFCFHWSSPHPTSPQQRITQAQRTHLHRWS